MEIKVLGPGCANCQTLAKRTEEAVQKLGIEATITKITDYDGMLKYGLMSSPGLVINEKLASSGRIPSIADITTLITSALAEKEA